MRLAALSSDEMTAQQVSLYRESSAARAAKDRARSSSPVAPVAWPGRLTRCSTPRPSAMLGTRRDDQVPHHLSLESARWRSWWWPRPGTAEDERASHEPIGREAGLAEPEIEGLWVGVDPGFTDKQEKVAYSVARALTGPTPTWTTRSTTSRSRCSARRPWSNCPRWSATTRPWRSSCASSGSPRRSVHRVSPRLAS